MKQGETLMSVEVQKLEKNMAKLTRANPANPHNSPASPWGAGPKTPPPVWHWHYAAPTAKTACPTPAHSTRR